MLGKRSSFLSDFPIFNYQPHETKNPWWWLLVVVVLNRDEARARRERKQIDSRFWKHTNHHRKFKIFIRRSTRLLLREDAGERGRRDREREEGETERKKYATNRPSRRGHCHGQKNAGEGNIRKEKRRSLTAFFSRGRNRSERDAEKETRKEG